MIVSVKSLNPKVLDSLTELALTMTEYDGLRIRDPYSFPLGHIGGNLDFPVAVGDLVTCEKGTKIWRIAGICENGSLVCSVVYGGAFAEIGSVIGGRKLIPYNGRVSYF